MLLMVGLNVSAGEGFKELINSHWDTRQQCMRPYSNYPFIIEESKTKKYVRMLNEFERIGIALDLTEQLNSFILKQEISPVQLIELQGKERKRATSTRKSASKISSQSKDTPTW